jgi:hypothetical protein
MLRFVALVRTDISEELSVSIIRVTRIGELGTMLAFCPDVITCDALLFLTSSSCYSPTDPAAPSLRSLVPKSSLIQCSNTISLWGQNFRELPVLPCPPLSSCYAGDNTIFLFGGWWIFHKVLLFISVHPTADLMIQLLLSSRRAFLEFLLDTLFFPWNCCSLRSRSLMPFLYSGHVCHVFRMSAHSGFLLLTSSLVPFVHFPFADQGRRGVSVISGWRTTSAGTQYCLGSASLPIDDAAQPSVYRVPATPLRLLLILDLPPNSWPPFVRTFSDGIHHGLWSFW